MATTQINATLAAHPFLEGLKPEHIEKLASMAFETTFAEDQIIFREGDPSSFFYLILHGRVALEMVAPGRVVSIQTVGDGDELGWSSLLSDVQKQFRARALEPVQAVAFDGTRLVAACEKDHEFGYILIRKVLTTVADRLRSTRMQVIDVFSKKGGPVK